MRRRKIVNADQHRRGCLGRQRNEEKRREHYWRKPEHRGERVRRRRMPQQEDLSEGPPEA